MKKLLYHKRKMKDTKLLTSRHQCRETIQEEEEEEILEVIHSWKQDRKFKSQKKREYNEAL